MAEAVAAGEERAAATLGGPVSVRSSGIGEDSRQTSFAGQHLTVLNVRDAAAAIAAMTGVWGSSHSETARSYRELLGVEEEPKIGIVVQRLVEPDTAGVLLPATR